MLRPLPGGPSRWRLALPWPLDPWGLGRAGFRVSVRLVVVVVMRLYSRSSPSWRPACQGCYTTALRRLMTFFPADRLRAVVVLGMVSLSAAAALRGSGWLRRLLARQRHQGSVPWPKRPRGSAPRSPPGPLPGFLAGWGCCALASARAARA